MCFQIFNKINMKIIMILTTFCCIIYAEEAYKPCYPDDPIYENIEILDAMHCNSTPCPVRRGSNVTTTASFITEENHNKIYIAMYFDLNGVKINYSGEHHANACDNVFSYPDKVKVGCPIEKGKRYIFERTTHIKSNIPKIPRILIHWAIRDHETKKDVVCYEFILKII